MIVKLSNKLTDFFISKKLIDVEERETYCYCFEVFIAFMINMILVVTIGFASLQFLETIVFLVVFLSLRTFAGGFHAKTHMKCIMLFITVFSVFIALLWLWESSLIINLLISLVSCFLINIVGPVDCEENRLTIKHKRKLKIRTLMFSMLFTALCILIACFGYDKIAFSLAYPMAIVCISIIHAKLIKQ